MSVLVYNYEIIEPGTGKKLGAPNITINYEVKLIVINNNYDTEGSVVDSSETFVSSRLTLDSNRSNQGRYDLGKSMSQSNIFKNFWAKWASKIGEKGYDSIPDPGTFYFGLQLLQTFKGDANYAGFSNLDYLFVPHFNNIGNECTSKDCSSPEFDFWDLSVGTIYVDILQFDKDAVTTAQIKAADARIKFEVAKKNYQAELIAQSNELILSTYDYQPTNFTNVITRLLEFKEGTLITSLDFAENANLTQLYTLLGPTNGIYYEIESLAGLYPSINIEDGEGIPYGDGIPGIYEFFGWGYREGEDIFSVVNVDGSSVSNYGIITRNGTEILDTRDFTASLQGYEYFVPRNEIQWGDFQDGDILICTIFVTDYLTETVNFNQSNFGSEQDIVSSGVTISRGINDGIYNSNVESDWDSGLSPSGTTWNSSYNSAGGDYGWEGLNNVSSRNFGTFYDAIGQDFSNDFTGLELVMYDETVDEYWAVKFTVYDSPQKGGGFEYTRKLIDPAGVAVSYQDSLVWKG